MLLVQVARYPETWMFVGGRAKDADPSFAHTAAREVCEEAGLLLPLARFVPVLTLRGDFEDVTWVHFYRATLTADEKADLAFHKHEILRHCWVPRTAATGLPMYRAMRTYIDRARS
jgi:8-oxo-dGTP pyrophosphatase MutT (NUDIX family)